MQTVTEKINKELAAVLLLLLIVLTFFSPMLFGGKTLFYRDLTVLAYPMKHLTFQAYHQGVLPFWNPTIYSGSPFFAVMYTSVLYPLNLIFFLNDFVTAFNWFYILHYVLLTVSVYALTRYWGLSTGAALCASITALLSGFFLSLPGTTAHFYSGVWLPSIFLFCQKFLNERKSSSLLGAVFCLTCQILGGSPEFFALTVVTLFFWLLTQTSETDWTRKVLQCGMALIAVVVLSLGLAAPQLFSTYSMIGESTRSAGMDFDLHARWSLQPQDLTTLLAPKNFKGFMETEHSEPYAFIQSLYMGLFAMFFLGFQRFQQKETHYWTFVFLIGIFFALGKYNPLYHLIYDLFPLLRLFRYPEKFYFISAYSQVFLVGYGVDALVKSTPTKNPTPLLTVWFGLVLGLTAIALAIPERIVLFSFVCLLIFGFSCYLFFLRKLNAVEMKLVLFLLIFFDLILNDHMLVPMTDKKFYEDLPGAAYKINDDKELSRLYVGKIVGNPDQFLVPKVPLMEYLTFKAALFPDLGTIYGMQYADGVSGWGLQSQDQLLWTAIFHKSPADKRLRILKRGNVRYWITPPTISTGNEGLIKLETLDDALPRAFIVPTARQGKDPQLLNTYYDASFDPRREVLLSEPVAMHESPDLPDFAGSVSGIRYGINQVTVNTQQTGTGFLVLLDSWFPGWTVTVDGVSEHMLRANHFYRAVQLESGNHVVQFIYTPVGFKTGLAVAEATGLLLFVWCAFRILAGKGIS